MMAQKKKLCMLLYPKLVRKGFYHSASDLLQFMIGLRSARSIQSDVKFWCGSFDLDFKQWYKNG